MKLCIKIIKFLKKNFEKFKKMGKLFLNKIMEKIKEEIVKIISKFKTKQPEVKQPEVKEPEVKEPEVKEPEVKQPEVKQPAEIAGMLTHGELDTLKEIQNEINSIMTIDGKVSTDSEPWIRPVPLDKIKSEDTYDNPEGIMSDSLDRNGNDDVDDCDGESSDLANEFSGFFSSYDD